MFRGYAHNRVFLALLDLQPQVVFFFFFTSLKASGLLPAFASLFIQEVLGHFPGCRSLEFQCHVSTHYNISIVTISTYWKQ